MDYYSAIIKNEIMLFATRWIDLEGHPGSSAGKRIHLQDKWIRKLWYIYTMEYYSAIKKNIFESALMRWMKLEHIIQSEVRKRNSNTVY